jgi:hypothetical protein
MKPAHIQLLDQARDALRAGKVGFARALITLARRQHAATLNLLAPLLHHQYRRCVNGRWAPVLATGTLVVVVVGRERYAHRQSAQRAALRMLREAVS